MISVFYNQTSLVDTLIINVNNQTVVNFDITDKCTVGYDGEHKVSFINIFNVSENLELKSGYLKLNHELVTFVKQHTKIDLSNYLNDVSFVVGYVQSCEVIEDTHLHVCKINVGIDTRQIVCGAPNIKTNDKVVVALPGATMPNGLCIKPSKLLNYESNGMVCSARELNLLDASFNKDGIILLSDNYQIGAEFKPVYSN
jgi:tRNA-binding protein